MGQNIAHPQQGTKINHRKNKVLSKSCQNLRDSATSDISSEPEAVEQISNFQPKHKTKYKIINAAGSLPSERIRTASVYDGVNGIYIIGGFGTRGTMKDVLRYDLHSGRVSRVGQFPQPVACGHATLDGLGTFLYFGGVNGHGETDFDVYAFTKASPDPARIDELPNHVTIEEIASHGTGTYLLCSDDNIYGYNIVQGYTGIVTRGSDCEGSAAVSVEGVLYQFGGGGEDESCSEQILKFSKHGGTELLEAKLVGGFANGAAVAVGTDIYVIGGINDDRRFRLSRFNTLAEELEELEVLNCKEPLTWLNAVYVPKLNRIYLICGIKYGDFTPCKRVRYIQL